MIRIGAKIDEDHRKNFKKAIFAENSDEGGERQDREHFYEARRTKEEKCTNGEIDLKADTRLGGESRRTVHMPQISRFCETFGDVSSSDSAVLTALALPMQSFEKIAISPGRYRSQRGGLCAVLKMV